MTIRLHLTLQKVKNHCRLRVLVAAAAAVVLSPEKTIVDKDGILKRLSNGEENAVKVLVIAAMNQEVTPRSLGLNQR